MFTLTRKLAWVCDLIGRLGMAEIPLMVYTMNVQGRAVYLLKFTS
jgi:hypothetical protein